MNAKQKKNRSINTIGLLLVCAAIIGCNNSAPTSEKNNQQLPFFGEFDIELNTQADGTQHADTLYYPIPKFSFVNQDSVFITQEDYRESITL